MNTTGSTTVAVTVVDDDPYVRHALTSLLDAAPDVEIASSYSSGENVTAVDAVIGDVVLMDIRMPGVGGIAATEVLMSRPNPPKIIMLTTFDLDRDVARSLQAGAAGYLLKGEPPDTVISSIRAVTQGDTILSPSVTRQLVTMVRETTGRMDEARKKLASLSDQETRIAQALGKGSSNSEISDALYISIPTVKTHISSIFRKLDATNRLQVALIVRDAHTTHNPRLSPPER
ncbi:response regulator transcription factor [Corynebacterium glyciniphilum]|uniref:response regulator transcription factor n=1 Tax=Corynebacterium glyciniphilum TaxID=1404244 RepID=UPI00264E7763|nr:response regulator transcription factor [Corynebacterium glyciniphilum]MDN5683829.1 response regulator transcription factor [Corynebacterium glyciniphilum]